MSDKIIVTSSEELQQIVDQSVEKALKKANENNNKFISEKEAMALWLIKDKRTLYKRINKYGIKTYFINNQKCFKEIDIKSIIQA